MLVSLNSTKAAMIAAAHVYHDIAGVGDLEDTFNEAIWGTEECGHMELAYYLQGMGYPAITDTVGGRNLHKAWHVQASRGYQVFALFSTNHEREGYGWAMPAHDTEGREHWVMLACVGTQIIGKVANDEVYTGVCTVVEKQLPPQGTVCLRF